MIFGIAAVIPALFFVVGVLRDRRRLANAVWLGVTLVLLLLWLLFRAAALEGRAEVAAGYAFAVVLVGLGLVLPVALIANGVLMLKREGFKLANLLSLLAGLAIFGVGFAFAFATARTGPLVDAVIGALLVVAAYVAFLFVSLLLYSVVYGSVGRRSGFDAIVVLGAGLIGDRVPPLLANRLDRALRLYRREVGAGREPLVVVSGGQGSDEAVPEAVAMRDYLVRRGVPEEAVVLEDRATTTRQNLGYSAELLAERGRSGRAVAVTNNFHVFRAAVLARGLRLRMQIIGAPTAWYFLPSAFLREFVALLAQNPVAHVVTCGLLVAGHLVLALT
ncbi:YdcF family protein [Saccharothrix syringae]|uniref:YdcF family protein n=1 Tax=Saccharothrix syringae TaxID=103733 RepID=A0A5Q0H6Z5_SACSY|nr:YdcF family protein [Saccharothrix syringae]QFZ21733.1 YdcF family protein [Saccharothrix syringae]